MLKPDFRWFLTEEFDNLREWFVPKDNSEYLDKKNNKMEVDDNKCLKKKDPQAHAKSNDIMTSNTSRDEMEKAIELAAIAPTDSVRYTCPICATDLIEKTIDNKYTVHYCLSCHRDYYQMKPDDDKKIVYDDLQSLSEDNAGPILLCLEDKQDKTKEPKSKSNNDYKDYLKKYFGSHVKITTRTEFPN